MTLRPDILSSLEPSNNILGVFRGAAFYFPKSILLPFFFLNHLLLSYCHFLSSQTLQPVGYFIYPPFLPDPLFSSGLIWLFSRPATHCHLGFPLLFTITILLLFYCFLDLISFLWVHSVSSGKKCHFSLGRVDTWLPVSHPWRIQLLLTSDFI